MKILWITNILFEHHCTMVGLDASKVTGGSWLNAAYVASLSNSDIQLHIATSGNNKEILQSERDGNVFYIIPGGGTCGYDVESEANFKQWQKLRFRVNPDAVIIWGTETRFAYVAMKAMGGIPMAIYMQGVIESIYNHYFEGLPEKYQNATFRDIVDKLNRKSSYRTFQSQVSLERGMFRMATGVIVENDWCEDMCKSVNPNLKVFRNNLPIREVFKSKEWSLENMELQSIFTNAGGYPIKGHHILFQALGLVKERFPEFKCYVPGPKLCAFDSIKRQTGYTKMLKELILAYGLSENIIYTGCLSSEEMVEYLAKCNVYVMPSIMENHSSSLIEAMMVGTPSISSLVGGTASLVRHKENAILYNSLDVYSLAGNIIRIFEDNMLAKKLSKNALMIRKDREGNFGEEMNEIYKCLIE
ncbi:glycosyltransferase [Bacteroides sp. GM023]|uniref:glycosyltransferase n=1 Tax=Bacteroides sp. GM023 TaxID=2723058 RepID=UPI00168A8D68|nr:glycosyltransferase [Bacteroides sp. GM023]MBD3589411.1 glycosyltransferase family 4 protein [Bacteroides sp. GM023]